MLGVGAAHAQAHAEAPLELGGATGEVLWRCEGVEVVWFGVSIYSELPEKW